MPTCTLVDLPVSPHNLIMLEKNGIVRWDSAGLMNLHGSWKVWPTTTAAVRKGWRRNPLAGAQECIGQDGKNNLPVVSHCDHLSVL